MKNDFRLQELRKFVAPEFIFGADSLQIAGNYCKKIALKKVLIISDNGVINAGITAQVQENIEQFGIEYVMYSDVSPNPRDYEIMNGTEVYLLNHCDGIIAVGGGSVMDCAKGVAITAVNSKHILEFEGVNKVEFPMPPLICIPTTAGTASEVSQFAIINNTLERCKIAIISKAVVPDLAIIDPLTLLTMDNYLTACTGLDALSHAIEAYVSTASSPITDNFAIEAIKLIGEYLPKSIIAPDNLDYRAQMMMASLQAGLAFSNASLGIIHSMAHSLGGYLDLAHGECNSMLLSTAIDYNFDTHSKRFNDIALALGLNNSSLYDSEHRYSKSDIIKFMEEFKLSVGIDKRLSDRNVKLTDIPILSEKALKDPCNATNPRTPNIKDIETLYSEAL